MVDSIVIQGLRKEYYQSKNIIFTAVKNLNIAIPHAQVFGFLGPNGAGKTTTIKILCGIVTPTQGNVYLNGYHTISDRKKAMQQIGVVLEGARNTYWQLSAWDNVIYYARLKNYRKLDLYDRAHAILRQLGLWERRHEVVGALSRGMQQKVSIACALIADPPIIILDEPTLGLDIQSAQAIKNLIKELSSTYKKTILLTTHQLDVAESLCDRVGMMYQGDLVIDQPIHQLLEAAGESYKIVAKGKLIPEDLTHFHEADIAQDQDIVTFSGLLADSQTLYTLIEKTQHYGLQLISATRIKKTLEEVFTNLLNN